MTTPKPTTVNVSPATRARLDEMARALKEEKGRTGLPSVNEVIEYLFESRASLVSEVAAAVERNALLADRNNELAAELEEWIASAQQ